jgi:hypothetical protein
MALKKQSLVAVGTTAAWWGYLFLLRAALLFAGEICDATKPYEYVKLP